MLPTHTGATAAAGGATRPTSGSSGSRRRRDPDWLEEEDEGDEKELELEGALEALLREGAGPRKRPPSPLSASAGAAGAKLLDGSGDDAKQPPQGAAAGPEWAEAVGDGKEKGKGKEPSVSEAEAALAARVRELEARLVETEALLGSDPGTVILALEVGRG